nr:hypothetical protein [Saprospira grandis]
MPAAGATLWGSQVCSALRFFALLKKLGLAFGHPSASLGQRQYGCAKTPVHCHGLVAGRY